jgi:imidazolonepropionase-like amidohydrolase
VRVREGFALVWMSLAAGSVFAQSTFSPEVREFVRVDRPVVALTHVRVIDGTGAPARADQTVVLRDGAIASLGDAATAVIPDGAQVLDLSGRSVLPGYVMVHEHMFYPAGRGAYNELSFSFPRMYLAGGVTTMRTGGSMEPYTDLNIRRAIDEGKIPGPTIDVTGPYLEGPGLPILAVKALRDEEDAREMVRYWAVEGATSFKAYMHISRKELAAAIAEVHERKLKITGHLCSVTYREAADLGIDDLEHGFLASTDFVSGKKPDECPPYEAVQESLLHVDPDGAEFQSLVRHLIDKGVAITSTLTVFEISVPGRPPAPDRVLDSMVAEARDLYLRRRSRIAGDLDSTFKEVFEKDMALEHAFAKAGGLLIAGTDPTGYGGVVAGYSNQRQVELLVEAGFTPLEAIGISTLNGAKYLGRADRIGTIEAGKEADLIVVGGDPSQNIHDVEKVELVFKNGVGFDSAKLFESARGSVGIR